MNQSFDVQLQVSLRALNDVIAPALSEADVARHVVEQLHLVIATLSFIKVRLPEARRFSRAELRSYIALAAKADELGGGVILLRQAIATGETILGDPDADIQDFESATRTLRDRVTAFYSQSAGTRFLAALEAEILSISGDHVDQCRQWCLPFGFEPSPGTIPAPAW